MKRLLTSHKLITALFAVLFTLTFHNIGNAQTHIHVDAVNGINAATGRGTAGNAYKSITFALLISEKSNLPDPWHVHIHPGTYDADPAKPANEREVFPLKLRSNMLFQGTTTAAECIIDAQHLGESNTSILFGGNVGDVSIRNLTIQNMRGSDARSAAVALWNQQGPTNSIEACIIHNNTGFGVSTNTPLVLIGNTFSSNSNSVLARDANVIVTGNIFNNNPGPSIEGVDSAIEITISDNTFDAGGMSMWSDLPITGNITRNKFGGHWGFTMHGRRFRGSLTADISHNTFQNNAGGGFIVDYRLKGNVTHNTFTENGASWSDAVGGFSAEFMEGNVTHNTFKKNTSADGVAGFSVRSRFNGEITHNRFEGNSVASRGSARDPRGIALSVGWHISNELPEANVKIANNIFFNNTGGDESTYVAYTNGPAVFENNLFMVVDGLSGGVPIPAVGMFLEPNYAFKEPEVGLYNNIFSGMRTAIYTQIPNLPITHNLFHNIGLDFVNQNGSGVGNDLDFWELLADSASNNIVGGLLLKDPGNGDFHPLAGSPTIDAGTNEYAPADDLDGVARPVDGTVDIGPYEYKGVSTDQTVTFLAEDVNQDGRVSIADLIEVAQSLRKPASENPRADVNGDGAISLVDLVTIANYIAKSRSDTPAAPRYHVVVLDAATVQTWLDLARVEDDGSLTFREGIANLEQLLASLLPKETTLLPNYPNPFNPETWIPYRLAKPAEVSIAIHATDGQLVRVLALGNQSAGMYQSRNRAAYWDGKNQIGEPVASGIYFYTLTAGDFNATRKMIIRK